MFIMCCVPGGASVAPAPVVFSMKEEKMPNPKGSFKSDRDIPTIFKMVRIKWPTFGVLNFQDTFITSI